MSCLYYTYICIYIYIYTHILRHGLKSATKSSNGSKSGQPNLTPCRVPTCEGCRSLWRATGQCRALSSFQGRWWYSARADGKGWPTCCAVKGLFFTGTYSHNSRGSSRLRQTSSIHQELCASQRRLKTLFPPHACWSCKCSRGPLSASAGAARGSCRMQFRRLRQPQLGKSRGSNPPSTLPIFLRGPLNSEINQPRKGAVACPVCVCWASGQWHKTNPLTVWRTNFQLPVAGAWISQRLASNQQQGPSDRDQLSTWINLSSRRKAC